jgi:hypothetical protein
MSHQWFRFYIEVLDDPKVQKLPPHLFKAWVNVLCIAGSNDGVLPGIDDIAFRLRSSVHDAQTQIDELIGLGLIDIRRDKKLEPHNWMKRQFVSDSSTERVRKFRQNHRKQPCNADETFHETPPEQNRADSESEQIPPKPPCEGGTAEPDFWKSKRARRRDRIAEAYEVIERMSREADQCNQS